MRSVAELLAAEVRQWVGKAPATVEEIAALSSQVPFPLPEEYVELLRASNGGEGELALPPLWFQLFDTKFAAELWRNPDYRTNFPDLFFFGSNGGLESIAFDMRGVADWPIVMIDCIAGMDSARQSAPNMRAFINAVGIPDRHAA